jgi:hypothetical protein
MKFPNESVSWLLVFGLGALLVWIVPSCDKTTASNSLATPVDYSDKPDVGRFQLRNEGDTLVIFDTATADIWGLKDGQWTKIPNPVEDERHAKLDRFMQHFQTTNTPPK